MEDLKKTFDDLAEYRARVEAARLNQSAETIYNSSHRHAGVLIEQLFLDARSRARIICRGLCPRSFGHDLVMNAAEQFLARDGAQLHVIVKQIEVDPATNANPFVQRFGGYPNVQIDVGELHVPFDFMVVDGRAYRYEADARTSVARASFNDPSMGGTLDQVFNTVVALRAA